MNLKNGKIFTSKFVGTGPSSCKKIIYRATVSQRLRSIVLDSHASTSFHYDGEFFCSIFAVLQCLQPIAAPL